MGDKSGRLLLAVDIPDFLMKNILALQNTHVNFFLLYEKRTTRGSGPAWVCERQVLLEQPDLLMPR